jgi:hypothetical protein
MRVTEYIAYITRENLALSKNPKEYEYTHLTLTNRIKRERYDYQKIQRRRINDEKYGSF